MSIFKFKQFEVDQSGCAMKINTDGVLLAAMVSHREPHRILDIGTGTGVLALMMAQRFPSATVVAVEIDESAAITAEKNFKASAFRDRLKAHHTAIEHYSHDQQFDLIISNPPFFVNDLKNMEEKKGIARHTNELFFDALIVKINALLSNTGSFWFILPVKQAETLVAKAKKIDLFVGKQIHLYSDKTRPEFRRIICLSKAKAETVIEHFYIYETEKVYTPAYKALLKDFFLGY